MLVRFFVKLLLFVGVAFGALFVIKGPEGIPFLKLDQLKAPDLANPFEDVSDALDGVSDSLTGQISDWVELDQDSPEATSKVWRWQDENGQWHFSNTPVAGAEEKFVTPNTSIKISQLVSKAKASDNAEQPAQQNTPKKPTDIDSIFLPEQAAKGLEQAQQVEAMLKQANERRMQQLDDL